MKHLVGAGVRGPPHRARSLPRCFFIAQSYVLVKKWSEALVLYDRVLKYASEASSDRAAKTSLKVSCGPASPWCCFCPTAVPSPPPSVALTPAITLAWFHWFLSCKGN